MYLVWKLQQVHLDINAFAKEMTLIAQNYDNVVLLSADIGNRLFNDYKKMYPDRFYNCGVAEANMTGMAAGMALSGLRPITYTITSFNTYRCFEQIRVDICYHNLPVVIVGVGSGLSYASLGATHHSCEDIAIMRTLPNMTIVCPGDALEVRQALRAAINYNAPVYIRIGKKNEPVVHTHPPEFSIGKGLILKEGSDVCFLSTGTMLPIAMEAATSLDKNGISTQVVSFHTVKPLDTDLLESVSNSFSFIATIEEHSIIGGLGSSISEFLMKQRRNNTPLLHCFGTPDFFLSKSQNQDRARKKAGLIPTNIIQTTIDLYSSL